MFSRSPFQFFPVEFYESASLLIATLLIATLLVADGKYTPTERVNTDRVYARPRLPALFGALPWVFGTLHQETDRKPSTPTLQSTGTHASHRDIDRSWWLLYRDGCPTTFKSKSSLEKKKVSLVFSF
jgi:hypothetical protein